MKFFGVTIVMLLFAISVVIFFSWNTHEIEANARLAVEKHIQQMDFATATISFNHIGIGEGDSGAFHYRFDLNILPSQSLTIQNDIVERLVLMPNEELVIPMEAVFQQNTKADWNIVSIYKRK